jgi:hypothetical protein
MPWLGIRGNGTLSHALPRKFRLGLKRFTIGDGAEVTVILEEIPPELSQ